MGAVFCILCFAKFVVVSKKGGCFISNSLPVSIGLLMDTLLVGVCYLKSMSYHGGVSFVFSEMIGIMSGFVEVKNEVRASNDTVSYFHHRMENSKLTIRYLV